MSTPNFGVLMLCCLINLTNGTIWLYTVQQITAVSHKLLSEGTTNPCIEVYLYGGAAAGCFVCWLPLRYLGHKTTLQLVSSSLQIAGSCLVFAYFWLQNTQLLLAGSCLVGAAVGLCFVAVPVCVLDITTSEQCTRITRSLYNSVAALVLSTQLAPAVGNLLATVFPLSLATPLYLAPLCGTAVSVFGFCLLHHPPRKLCIFKQHKVTLGEHCSINERAAEAGIWVKLVTFLRALCLATCLLSLSDFAGIEVCNFYSDWVLKFAGLDTQVFPRSQLRNALLRVSLVTLTFILIAYCNSRWLEGICLIFSSALVSLSLFSMGLCLFGLEQGENWTWAVPWIPFSAFLIFQVAFWIGIGTLAHVATFTYTAASFRRLVLSLGGSLHFLLMLVEKTLLIRMIDALHPFGTFWFYAGTSATGLVLIVFLIVPEIYRLKGGDTIVIENDSSTRHLGKRLDEIPMTEI